MLADPFVWNTKRERAAQLVAEDLMADTKIAAEVGVELRTLTLWKSVPAFKQRVAELVGVLREQIMQQGVANLATRIRSADERWRKLQAVIDARAQASQLDSEEVGRPAGAETGLIVLTSVSKQGDKIYAVDTGLLAEMRNLEMHVAKQLGQWTEKSDVTSAGGPIGSDLDDDRLLARIEELRARAAQTTLP